MFSSSFSSSFRHLAYGPINKLLFILRTYPTSRLDKSLLDRCVARMPGRAHLPLCRDCEVADHKVSGAQSVCSRFTRSPPAFSSRRQTSAGPFVPSRQTCAVTGTTGNALTGRDVGKNMSVGSAGNQVTLSRNMSSVEQEASTPVRVANLEELLKGHRDRVLVSFLLYGFSFGFSIGYERPFLERATPNARSAHLDPAVISRMFECSVLSKYTKGPFVSKPFPGFVVNALELRR